MPDVDGRPRAYVATYVDITERKQAENALAAHVAQVEPASGGPDGDRRAHARRTSPSATVR